MLRLGNGATTLTVVEEIWRHYSENVNPARGTMSSKTTSTTMIGNSPNTCSFFLASMSQLFSADFDDISFDARFSMVWKRRLVVMGKSRDAVYGIEILETSLERARRETSLCLAILAITSLNSTNSLT